MPNKELKLLDENGMEWKSHSFNVNGIELKVATNGTIVRLMSLDHIYMEVDMHKDMIYQTPPSNYYPPKPFIQEGEMEI